MPELRSGPEVHRKGAEYRIIAVTDKGTVRSQNEDTIGLCGWALTAAEGTPLEFAVRGVAPLIVVVADGMGGHRGGATASRIVAESLTAPVLADVADGTTYIVNAIVQASRDLLAVGRERPEFLGMGSTVAGVLLRSNGTGVAFNVGDSRVYHYSGGFLGQLSVDDRPASSFGRTGQMTQCLGGSREVRLDPHLFEFEWSRGDRLLICSDGLHDVLDDLSMEAALRAGNSGAAQSLVERTLVLGANDNVSVVTIDWLGELKNDGVEESSDVVLKVAESVCAGTFSSGEVSAPLDLQPSPTQSPQSVQADKES